MSNDKNLATLKSLDTTEASADIYADMYYDEKTKSFKDRVKTPAQSWQGISRKQVIEIVENLDQIVAAAVKGAEMVKDPAAQLQALISWGNKKALTATTTGNGRHRKEKPRPHAGFIRSALATAPPALLKHYADNPEADPRVIAQRADAEAAAAPQQQPAPAAAPQQPAPAEVNRSDYAAEMAALAE